jgi:prepilin-type N-terminal cleavage/methylation domain-containing protein
MLMRKKGFSLAELLAGMVVGAIVILMISAMATISAKSYKDLQDRSASDSDAQFAIDSIRSAVRQSSAVPSVSGTTLTIDSNHRFVFSGNNLSYQIISPASTARILSGVSAVSFTVSGSSLITVVLNYTKAGVAYSYSIEAARRSL